MARSSHRHALLASGSHLRQRRRKMFAIRSPKATGLLDLPNELLVLIACRLCKTSLVALSRANRLLYEISSIELYKGQWALDSLRQNLERANRPGYKQAIELSFKKAVDALAKVSAPSSGQIGSHAHHLLYGLHADNVYLLEYMAFKGGMIGELCQRILLGAQEINLVRCEQASRHPCFRDSMKLGCDPNSLVFTRGQVEDWRPPWFKPVLDKLQRVNMRIPLLWATICGSTHVLIHSELDLVVERRCDCTRAIKKAKGSLDEVRLLLECGADPNAHLEDGTSALHLATAICRPDLVTLLIEWGADLNARNLRGRTSLHVAARLKQRDGNSSLRRDTIDALLDLPGIGVDLRDGDGRTPLSLAVSFKQNVSSQYLARKLVNAFDVDINSQDNSGKTVLYHSTEMKNEELTRLLLIQSRIDPQRNPSMLPLFHAVQRSPKMAWILLEANSTDSNMKDAKGIPAIGQTTNKRAIKLLINAGAEVDLTTRQELNHRGIDLDQLMAHGSVKKKRKKTRWPY